MAIQKVTEKLEWLEDARAAFGRLSAAGKERNDDTAAADLDVVAEGLRDLVDSLHDVEDDRRRAAEEAEEQYGRADSAEADLVDLDDLRAGVEAAHETYHAPESGPVFPWRHCHLEPCRSWNMVGPSW